MAEEEGSPIRGTGPRSIAVTEAAEILRVSEDALLGWISAGLVSCETSSAGEPLIRLRDEVYETSPGRTSTLVVLELHRGVSDEKVALYGDQLRQHRREHALAGLAWTGVSADLFTELLAARLAEVVPDTATVSAEGGMLWVAGSGVDVARIVSDGDHTVDERLVLAAETMLEKASESIAELTSEPWPARAGDFRDAFPPFAATILNGELLMSYGDPADPILRLAPLNVSDVTTA
jgi:hypothetical protein